MAGLREAEPAGGDFIDEEPFLSGGGRVVAKKFGAENGEIGIAGSVHSAFLI